MKARTQNHHILSAAKDADLELLQLVMQAKLEWQQTIDSLPWPLVMTDLDGRIIRANLATAKGDLDRIRKLPGQRVSVIVQESGRQVVESKKLVQSRLADVAMLEKGPTLEAAQLISAPIKGRDGEIERIVHSLIDQQDEFRLRRRVEESRRMSSIGMLASGIMHNLSSPLQAMLGQIELIDMKEQRPERVSLDRSEWEMLRSQAERMEGIIGSLLQKLRSDQDLRVKQVDMNELLGRELELLNANLNYKHTVSKVISLDPQLAPVLALSADVSQALVNVLNNALDAMYESSEKVLRIVSRVDPDGFSTIRITDTGTGISGKTMKKIFEPFFTTKPSAGDGKGHEPCGTGLGLSSSRYLLDRYQMTLHCESVLSQGSTFIFRWKGSAST
jgi:signal transduction histidine kinase